MKKLFVRIFATIGVLVTINAVVMAAFLISRSKPEVPKQVILEVDFSQPFVEFVPDDPAARFMLKEHRSVRSLVDALEQAAEDERVVALVARVGDSNLGLAQTDEIRDALKVFRAAGKPAIAWAEGFGEFSSATGQYYLATAFDKIYLYPSGDVGITGLTFTTPFLRGALDKLEIEPRIDQRYEYKNAANFFTETEYTDAHREAMEGIMGSLFDHLVAGIAEGRGMTADQVRGLFDQGPFFGREALTAGLVDALKYRDEVYKEIKANAGDNAELLYAGEYLRRAGRRHSEGDRTIALIYGVGDIHRGHSQFQMPFGGQTLGSETIARAFRAAIEDEDVEAIVFRVDSPGGSALASDVIWRETVRAKEAGKPVIVSMGNVAGSGGYWIAMHADKIVAQPMTITGSIGVLAGKMVMADFWESLGVTFDKVQTSRNGTLWSSVYDYTPAEWERLQAALDRIYEDFVTKVADGRGITPEQVREVAKGRIWTGAQAKELGLVDELGGFPTALRLAREAAGIGEKDKLEVKLFPRPQDPIKALLGGPAKNSEDYGVSAGLEYSVEGLEPLAQTLHQLGLAGQAGVLSTPAYVEALTRQ